MHWITPLSCVQSSQMALPIHLEQITQSLPWPMRPHTSCPLTASLISSLPGSLLLTCSMPSSFPPQGLCTCFSQLRTFLLHILPRPAPSHSSGFCPSKGCHVLKEAFADHLRHSSTPALSHSYWLIFRVLITIRHDLDRFVFACSCLAPHFRRPWAQRLALSTAKCPVASTEPYIWGLVDIYWIT